MNYQTPITDLVKEFTQDIDNIKDKQWLKPALISHLSKYTPIKEHTLSKIVDCFFDNPDKY